MKSIVSGPVAEKIFKKIQELLYCNGANGKRILKAVALRLRFQHDERP